jgi:hypothetical protein
MDLKMGKGKIAAQVCKVLLGFSQPVNCDRLEPGNGGCPGVVWL